VKPEGREELGGVQTTVFQDRGKGRKNWKEKEGNTSEAQYYKFQREGIGGTTF